MNAPLKTRKIVRVAASSTVAGAALALLFLGAPADAAVLVQLGRGYS